MIGFLDALSRPLLQKIDAETAHRWTIELLSHLPLPIPAKDDPRLGVEAFGLTFANPVGLAAGFDKNGEALRQILKLGFGFTEIGTVTPRPQPGNPRPRVFRLPADHAVINRYGFNSAGHAEVMKNLARLGVRPSGLVAVNLGANKDAADRVADYVEGVKTFAALADFLVINISSPNTPGLRDLQHEAALDDLIARVIAARNEAALASGRRPILVKIAPDLDESDLDSIIGICRARKIDGLIVANTTIARPSALQDQATARETGGLSGRPLFASATRVLALAYMRVERQFPLVGVGGIDSPRAAFAKIEAGATLVELYTGLVYEGIRLVAAIKGEFVARVAQRRLASLKDVVGTAAQDWASGKIKVGDLNSPKT